MVNVVSQGPNVIKAHLLHLRDHNQMAYLSEALEFLEENGVENPLKQQDGKTMNHQHAVHSGCPGSRSMAFTGVAADKGDDSGQRPSRLTHWPVQLHLMSPMAPQYEGADVLLSADCVAYSLGDFHKDYLKGKALAIACPKLDDGQEVYLEKITALIDEAKINTLTVMIMEVPCCGGLLQLAKKAAAAATRKVPIKCLVVGLQGDIKREEWV